MILEDLNASGYNITNQVNGLDNNHLKVALQKLAIWHAVTASMILDVSVMCGTFPYI